ncbi:ECR-like protein [Mya arenaria]|uniref:ECR-like protein n=1 Tax=Mya arenaria TaxID=6604 RepID=A0ABY7DAZ2_MYAAR|nr:ECR-like protein [Mya arenaria]
MYFIPHELGWKTYVGKPQNFNELSLPQQLVNSCALACKRPVPQPVPECSTLPNLQHQDGRYTTVKEVLGNVKYGRHYVLRYGCSCDIIAAQTHYHQVRPSACSEVMAIRAARCYDLASRTIVLANGTPCSVENMMAAGGSEAYWKLVFQFCHALADSQTDNTEYALFTAICIFSVSGT